ncbi:MAG: prolyl oligopeptidase family serine peptidase [Clostridia bacterium]|nr:prolyl oligopeptidase family serine peptidase [Clostridia bacterium]MBR7032782.1 prolyl oligopeptidase family serine peptidase [Clostridia bacterium]
MITYDNLRSFAYSNDKLIRGAPRGIAVSFSGLGCAAVHDSDTEEGRAFARENVIFLIPYHDPWAWGNSACVKLADESVAALCEKYGDLPVCSTGGSMGGQGALVFCRYSESSVVSCVVNCPVCDTVFHFNERPDLPRTMYAAFSGSDDFNAEIRARSPLHIAEELPKIPYTVFHCEKDGAVNISAHSEKFVEKMRSLGHNVTYIKVPGRDHCDLPEDEKRAFFNTVKSSFR